MINPFEIMMIETVYIVNKNKERSVSHKVAPFSKGKVAIFSDTAIDVKEGYKVIHLLPDGKEDIFTILEVNYTSALRALGAYSIPAHYSLKIKKDSSLLYRQDSLESATINISNSQGIQVGDHNIQNIANSIGELIGQVDLSNNTTGQKKKAKEKIRELLNNPTVAAILGNAVAGLLARL